MVALPRLSMIRKIDDLVKRSRHAKVHAHIIGYMKEQLPTFGKARQCPASRYKGVREYSSRYGIR